MTNPTDYLADVHRYDPEAEDIVIQKIVRHLGFSLRNAESSLVDCSDQTEKDQIQEKWVEGTLGLSGDTAQLVSDICEEMQGDTRKQRVTFYYLAAKYAGKLDDL